MYDWLQQVSHVQNLQTISGALQNVMVLDTEERVLVLGAWHICPTRCFSPIECEEGPLKGPKKVSPRRHSLLREAAKTSGGSPLICMLLTSN